MQTGYVFASHVTLPLLAGSLRTAVSMSRLKRWWFWTRSIWRKIVKIAMHDDDCIEDISCEFDEFCRKNGRIIAQRIEPFLPAHLLVGFRSGQAVEGAGPWGLL